jgi:hypothetical protein
MPQQLPDIPKVDRKTSYQGLKGIVAKLRDEFIRSYLVDSASVTVVDNPGKTRSAEVNFPNQSGGATFTITTDGTETVPDSGFFLTFQIFNTGLPTGTPLAVDFSGEGYPLMLAGSNVVSGTITLNYWHAEGNVLPPYTLPVGTITVRSVA